MIYNKNKKPLRLAAFFVLRFLFLTVLYVYCGCTDSADTNSYCMELETVGIQFTKPFSYQKADTLVIDNLKFTHVSYLDSLELGNYLPKKDAVIVEVRGKQATEDTNEISMGRSLARQLKKSGDYKILNGPELMTSGKLRFARLDGKKIKICLPQEYDAMLLN